MKAEEVLKKLKKFLDFELSICERVIKNFKRNKSDKAYDIIRLEVFVEYYYYKEFIDFVLNKIKELENDRR